MKLDSEFNDKLLPLTEAAFYVLLALHEPRHGYGIMQEVALVSHGEMRMAPGTLYGLLTKLLSQGLIQREGESGDGDERRKVYALTKTGKVLLEKELQRLETLVKIGRSILFCEGGIE